MNLTNLYMVKQAKGLKGALVGAGVGAGVGALSGEKGKRLKRGLIGGGIGGAAGFGASRAIHAAREKLTKSLEAMGLNYDDLQKLNRTSQKKKFAEDLIGRF